jgi:hypothetical protein
MAHLTAGSLGAYVRSQVAQGERLVAAHSPDRTGCCRRCGRPAPCDRAVHGQLLVDHFSSWSADDLGHRIAEDRRRRQSTRAERWPMSMRVLVRRWYPRWYVNHDDQGR